MHNAINFQQNLQSYLGVIYFNCWRKLKYQEKAIANKNFASYDIVAGAIYTILCYGFQGVHFAGGGSAGHLKALLVLG